MKTAILIGGCIRNSFSTFDNFVKNIVETNDADVFMLFRPNSEFDCEHEKNTYKNFEIMARELLGTRLKHYKYTGKEYDDIVNINCEICKKDAMSHKEIPEDVTYYNHQNNLISTRLVDQYTFCLFLANILENYEKNNNIKYDYVIRTRTDKMDFKVPLPICDMIQKYGNNIDETLYVCGSDTWYNESFFFGTHDIMLMVCRTFCTKLFHYHVNKSRHMFAPEVQFAAHCRALIHADGKAKLIQNSYPKHIKKSAKNCVKCSRYEIS